MGGLAKRVVVALDVRTNDAGDLVVTKGDQYDVREGSTAAGGEVRPARLARCCDVVGGFALAARCGFVTDKLFSEQICMRYMFNIGQPMRPASSMGMWHQMGCVGVAGAEPGQAGVAGGAVLRGGRRRDLLPQHHRLSGLPARRPAHAPGKRRPFQALKGTVHTVLVRRCPVRTLVAILLRRTIACPPLSNVEGMTCAPCPSQSCCGWWPGSDHDIFALHRNRSGLTQVLASASENVFVPLTVGGGIRDFTDAKGRHYGALEVAAAYFRSAPASVSCIELILGW